MNPVLINLVAGGMFFYFLSQTIDQRWWKGLPGEDVVFVRLEELVQRSETPGKPDGRRKKEIYVQKFYTAALILIKNLPALTIPVVP